MITKKKDMEENQISNNNLHFTFIGAQGVGKTTIMYEVAAALKKRGENVVVISEVARKCPFEINISKTQHAQKWIFCAQMLAEIEADGRNKNSIIISDRGPDNIAYFWYNFGEDKIGLYDIIKKTIKEYDCLFYIPIPKNFKIKDDGVRSTDIKFQKDIDKNIKILLIRVKAKYVEITSAKEIVNYILALKKQKLQK